MSKTTELNQLPDLASNYDLDAEQIASYQQNGHIFLRQVATPEEISAYRPIITQAAQRYNTETRPLQERDTYGKAFLQIMNLWQRDEEVRRFVLARRFAKIAADLMGAKGVRIYHDQALFKEAGGGPTPWHQDQYYWPLDTDKFVTMWMPLTMVTPEMGPMTFVTGSQREGYLGKFPISDESQARFQQVIQDRQLKLTTYHELEAGDATFHTGWMLHAAGANSTEQVREAMTIIYFADGAKIIEPDNGGRANDLQRWLPGLKVGDLAASVLNPLVYSTSRNIASS